jgi:hypothetical protein
MVRQQQMDLSTVENPDPTPWKILISLLDKWEIGASLVEEMLPHALQAAQRHAIAKDGQNLQEVMTI